MNKFRYSVIGQMLDVMKSVSLNAVVFVIVWMSFVALWTTSAGEYIFTVIGIFCYCVGIYGCGERACKNDQKPYVPNQPSLKKALYIPAPVAVLNILFVVLYKITWICGSNGDGITQMWAIITNILSYGWFSPFGEIMALDKGSISIIGIILSVILPFVLYFLGYFAATKKFDINDKLVGFMYEKKTRNK